MRSILSALALCAFAVTAATTATAADLPRKAPPVQAAPCTIQSCSGWYVGADLIGFTSNVDVLGQGVRNSLFAGGQAFGVHAGYQLWNGRFFAAFEAGVNYEVHPTSPGVENSRNRVTGLQLVKLGAGLNGLLGGMAVAPATGSQSPAGVTVPADLASALIAPYLITGAMQRGHGTQSVTGAGSEFLLSSGVNLSLEYLYGPPMNGDPATQMVRLGLNRKF